MTVTPRTEDLRDAGVQVGPTLPTTAENGDALVDGVHQAVKVDGGTVTGYIWFGGWQQIWQASRVTEGTLGAAAEAVAALAGSVASGGALSAEAAAVSALSGSTATSGQLGADAAAVAALSGTAGQTAVGTLAGEAAAVAALAGRVVVSGQVGAEAAAVAAMTDGAGAFDPLSIDWHAAFWADDPNWTDPGDGNAVSQWDDGSGNSRHATQATASNRPIFRSSNADFNGQATVEFDGSNDALRTASFTALTGETDYFLVAKCDDVDNVQVFVTGIAGSNRRFIFATADDWAIHAGSTRTAENNARDTNLHAFVANYTGQSPSEDTLEVDGTVEIFQDAGTESLTGLTLGNNSSSVFPLDGHIAFLGLADGGLTPTEKSDLYSWAQSYYDTP